MQFDVPQGQRASVNLIVTPAAPQDGVAQQWAITDNASGTPQPVDSLNITFSGNTPARARRQERMVLSFSIDPAVQTDASSWRFAEEGIVYCQGAGDYLQDISSRIEDNGNTLVLSVSCLSDEEESFNFRFMGVLVDNTSGVCQVLASADPGGSISRRN